MERLGFGVGVVNSFQNIALAVAPLVVGVILDKNLDDQAEGFSQISLLMGFISLAMLAILTVWSVQISLRHEYSSYAKKAQSLISH